MSVTVVQFLDGFRKWQVAIPMTEFAWKFWQLSTWRNPIREVHWDCSLKQVLSSYGFRNYWWIYTPSCCTTDLREPLLLCVVIQPTKLNTTFRLLCKFVSFSSTSDVLITDRILFKWPFFALTLDLRSSRSLCFLAALVVVWGTLWDLANACTANLSPTSDNDISSICSTADISIWK